MTSDALCWTRNTDVSIAHAQRRSAWFWRGTHRRWRCLTLDSRSDLRMEIPGEWRIDWRFIRGTCECRAEIEENRTESNRMHLLNDLTFTTNNQRNAFHWRCRPALFVKTTIVKLRSFASFFHEYGARKRAWLSNYKHIVDMPRLTWRSSGLCIAMICPLNSVVKKQAAISLPWGWQRNDL